MNQRIGIFNVSDVNAQLDTLRERADTLVQMQDGLRRDGDRLHEHNDQRFTQLEKVTEELEKLTEEIVQGVHAIIETVQATGDALNDVMARLKFYEENVTFLKIANKNYNAKVRDDAERASIAKKAREVRNAPPPPEATPPQATGSQLVPDDMNPLLVPEPSEGDAIMGTGELDDAVGHNHD